MSFQFSYMLINPLRNTLKIDILEIFMLLLNKYQKEIKYDIVKP